MKSSQHVLRWVGAESFVAAPTRPAPALLRFDSDDFMDRMLALLAETPQDLPKLVARPESWQVLAEPTPLPAPIPVPALIPALSGPGAELRSAPARALARSRGWLGFQRQGQPAQSPATTATVPAALLKPGVQPLKLFQPVHQRFYLAASDHFTC